MRFMTTEQVDAILGEYKSSVARRAHVGEEVRNMERLLKEMDHDFILDTSVIHVQSYENADMPRGGRTSDPTARLAMFFAEGKVPKDILELSEDHAAAFLEWQELDTHIKMVEGWLKGLNDKERAVIESRILEAQTWAVTGKRFTEVFGVTYSKSGLKRLKEAAMMKIYRIAGATPLCSQKVSKKWPKSVP